MNKKINILDANILYSLTAYLFIISSGVISHVSRQNFKIVLLLTHYFIILLPPIIYLIIKKVDIKKTLRLNKISLKHCLLIGVITILMYPLAVLGNVLFMLVLSLLGNLNVPQLPIAETSREYFIFVFLMAITPGITEEVFYRGFMLRGYEALGKTKAIIFTSILFGIFHFNLYNLMGPIVLGLVFGYLVILTDSIYAGIVGHIVNNFFAVTLGFLLTRFSREIQQLETSPIEQEISTTIALAVSAIFLIIIGAITVFIAYRLSNIIKADMKNEKSFNIEILDSNSQQHEDAIQNPGSLQEKRIGGFAPLVLVIPIIIFVIFMQISEIISLG